MGRAHRAVVRRIGLVQVSGGVLRLAARDARRIHAAHLPRTDADCGAVLRIDDGVGLGMLADTESEDEVRNLLRAGLSFRHDFQVRFHDAPDIAILHQQAAGDRPHSHPRLARVRHAIGQQQTKILLLRKHGQRGFIGAGRDDDFGKDFRWLLYPSDSSDEKSGCWTRCRGVA